MLSPVSKFERAKQMARLEQRKRIDAACSEEVTSKIANTKKRKQVERRLERPGGYANVKKKIKSQDEAELFVRVVFISRASVKLIQDLKTNTFKKNQSSSHGRRNQYCAIAHDQEADTSCE